MASCRPKRASGARNAATGVTVLLLLTTAYALPTPKFPGLWRRQGAAARGPDGPGNIRLDGGRGALIADNAKSAPAAGVIHFVRRWSSPVGLLVSLGYAFPHLVADFRECWYARAEHTRNAIRGFAFARTRISVQTARPTSSRMSTCSDDGGGCTRAHLWAGIGWSPAGYWCQLRS